MIRFAFETFDRFAPIPGTSPCLRDLGYIPMVFTSAVVRKLTVFHVQCISYRHRASVIKGNTFLSYRTDVE